MSTRSVIAEPEGDGWKGRYHHWDGYPSGVGRTIFDAYNGHFDGDLDAMIDRLITSAPGSWSTINGADFSLPNHTRPDRNLETCSTCQRPMWQHYRQYYQYVTGEKYNVDNLTPPRPDVIEQFDHSFVSGPDAPHGPEGDNGADFFVDSFGDDCGTEWAYVLCPTGLFVYERRFGKRGDDMGHGTGMFGMGASDTEDGGYWAYVTEIPWDREMSDAEWEKVDQGTHTFA